MSNKFVFAYLFAALVLLKWKKKLYLLIQEKQGFTKEKKLSKQIIQRKNFTELICRQIRGWWKLPCYTWKKIGGRCSIVYQAPPPHNKWAPA